ncbi:MAG: LysR family transcriptional regulator [Acidobacteriota bacterium]|nr:LysR family transcriptional regulator [Acidobacteriota bacterium]
MEIYELEVLKIVAEEKSFSRAAKILNRTQPAVSQAIRRLEDEIGEKLFDRSSKDGTLTDAGEVLLDYAAKMLNLRRAARNAVRELKALHRGKITLSANEHTVFYLLPLIDEFQRTHPFIKIDVKRGVASRIPKEIMAREVELGVISFKPKDRSVKAVAVSTDELVLIAAPGHPLAKHKTVSIRELGTERFIAHNAPSPYRQQVIEKFEKHRTELNIAIEMPSLEAIKRLVEMGAGVALVPRLTAKAEIKSGQLAGVSVNEMKFARRLHIVHRRGGVLSQAANEFLETAKKHSAAT